nr:transposase [Sphingobacterium sp. UBA1498]
MEKEEFDFERFKEEAMRGLYKGKKMGGEDGVFAPMLKHLLESMLEGELDHHLQESKASREINRKNGRTKKTVRSIQAGHFELESGRDQNGTFDPKIVPKRQLIITEELEGNVISMYARGMSIRDISGYVKKMYAMDISATEISNITDKVVPASMNGETVR